MKILGEVLEVFSATKESSGLPRPKVESLNLIKDYGIEFDKFAEKNLDQTVMIVGLKSYELAKSFNINLSIMCFLGIFLSQISFSLLVNLLYPILGIIGLFEIILLIITT